MFLYNLPSTGAWTLTRIPGGVETIGSGATTTVTVIPSGTFSYTVRGESGCTSLASANVVIDAQIIPLAPTVGTITQPNCNSATGSVVLNGLPSTGSWTLTRTPGGTITNGSGVSTTINGIPQDATYTYTVTNSLGCTSVASANILIYPQSSVPTAPVVGIITQPTCSVITGSVVLNGLPSLGTWTLTRTPGGATSTGSGTSTTMSGLTAGATYSYTVSNAPVCTSVSSANIVINSSPKPPTPVISQSGYILHSNALTGNQWYNQSGIINGATSQNYTVTTNDNYYVVVTLSGCSSDASNNIHIADVGIENIENTNNINVYPNPVSYELTIEIKGKKDITNFEIFNSIGQVVFKGTLVKKTTVETSSLPKGVYILRLENGKTFDFKKIVKE